MFLLNGNTLQLDTGFTDANGTQYPNNWLRLASPEEREAIGITEEPDPEIYDDRFYWGINNPKNIDQCKNNLVLQVKTTAASLLAPTDWKIIRSSETGSKVDLATLNERADIRIKSNEFEDSINACTTVEELAALSFDWGV